MIMIAQLTDIVWIPDLGLPDWCSSKEWIATVRRADGDGGIGRDRDRDMAVSKAFDLVAEQGRLF